MAAGHNSGPGFKDAGHEPFGDRYFGDLTLASLIPTPTYETSFLYREMEEKAIVWPDALSWHREIDAWLAVAVGDPRSVDSLIELVRTLPAADQVRVGLPWVEIAVLADVGAVARRSFLLSNWLTEVRPTAADAGVLDKWQELVDALVVAGNTSLAPYSE